MHGSLSKKKIKGKAFKIEILIIQATLPFGDNFMRRFDCLGKLNNAKNITPQSGYKPDCGVY